jgi:protein-disulfide isomerase
MLRTLVATLAVVLAPAAPAAARSDPFAGIHRNGLALGDPGAAVTIYVHYELQCPFCRRFDRRELPAFVERYVRTGRVRLVMRPLAFIGPDSVRAARAVAAAAAQDRAWELADELYRRQREENSGWVTDRLLRRAADAVPGLRVGRVMRERDGRRARSLLRAARRAAARVRFGGTPAFSLERPGADERLLDLDEYTADALGAAVEAVSP